MKKFACIPLCAFLFLLWTPCTQAQSWIDLLLQEIETYQRTNNSIAAFDRQMREYAQQNGEKTAGTLPEVYEGLAENAELDRIANKLRRIRNGDPVPSLTPKEVQTVNKALEDTGLNPARSARIDQIKAGLREAAQDSASAALEGTGWSKLPKTNAEAQSQLKSNAMPAAESSVRMKLKTGPARQITADTVNEEVAKINSAAAKNAQARMSTRVARTRLGKFAKFASRLAKGFVALDFAITAAEGPDYLEMREKLMGYRRMLADENLKNASIAAFSKGDYRIMKNLEELELKAFELEVEMERIEKEDRKILDSMTPQQQSDAMWRARGGI